MMGGPMSWVIPIRVRDGHFDHIEILLQKRCRIRLAILADQETNIWLALDNGVHNPFVPPKRNGRKQRLVQIINLFGMQGKIAPAEMHSHHGPGTEPLEYCGDLFCERRAKAESGRRLVIDGCHLFLRSAEPSQDDFPLCGKVLKKFRAATPHPNRSTPPPEADASMVCARNLKSVQFGPVQDDLMPERLLNGTGQHKRFQSVA